MENPTQDSLLSEILDIVKTSKNIAIVGVSDNPTRPSNMVTEYLVKYSNYNLFFVNPRIESLFGKPVYKSLKDIPVNIDLVDVFRKSEDIKEVMDEAIQIGAKAFWMQSGIVNEIEAARGRAHGIKVVQDRCLKIEHEKYLKLM